MLTASGCPRLALSALAALVTLVVSGAAAACGKSGSRAEGEVPHEAAALSPSAECTGASLRPSAVPPDQGMWMDTESSDSARVIAMIAPAEVRAGSAVVTRTIETKESAAGVASIQSRADSAVVHLELLPRYVGDRAAKARSDARADRATEPAAAYTLPRLVTLASYESCGGLRPAVVRYVRRDASGAVVRDAMLHRIPDTR